MASDSQRPSTLYMVPTVIPLLHLTVFIRTSAQKSNRKTESPRPALASGTLNDRGRYDSSSTEAGVLAAIAGPRPDPPEGDTYNHWWRDSREPPLLCPQGK
ncbi:hypothetical protein AVEN_273426-1 [Araneus ventricosus]|uniref:Uncharacterized protein n=1 Tax=Araneus ventricosus TaxID=182803 RepID=A0A4Y2E1Q2_ARAVE|nr:hypothetical protein AVEN_273426-1 [Araneus ventricosus]